MTINALVTESLSNPHKSAWRRGCCDLDLYQRGTGLLDASAFPNTYP
jgi:hypothetical protein